MPEPTKRIKVSDIQFTTETENVRPGVGAVMTGTVTISYSMEVSDLEWRRNRAFATKMVRENINHRMMDVIYGEASALARKARVEVMKTLQWTPPSISSALDGRHPALLLLDTIIGMSSGYAESVMPSGVSVNDLPVGLRVAITQGDATSAN